MWTHTWMVSTVLYHVVCDNNMFGTCCGEWRPLTLLCTMSFAQILSSRFFIYFFSLSFSPWNPLNFFSADKSGNVYLFTSSKDPTTEKPPVFIQVTPSNWNIQTYTVRENVFIQTGLCMSQYFRVSWYIGYVGRFCACSMLQTSN